VHVEREVGNGQNRGAVNACGPAVKLSNGKVMQSISKKCKVTQGIVGITQ